VKDPEAGKVRVENLGYFHVQPFVTSLAVSNTFSLEDNVKRMGTLPSELLLLGRVYCAISHEVIKEPKTYS